MNEVGVMEEGNIMVLICTYTYYVRSYIVGLPLTKRHCTNIYEICICTVLNVLYFVEKY